jgi:bifunctional non-homologous end joining protein LigD
LLTAKAATIDGEIAALDQNGKSSFQLLQSYGKTKQTPLVYYAFDLLFLDGTDLRSRPLTERRKLLANLLKKAPDNIRFSQELRAPETRFCEWRVSSASRPDGGRKYFGAFLVGYNGPAGRLLYAGRVGSGFSERALAELYIYNGLQTIRRATCPFVNLPEKRPGRWGLGITSCHETVRMG